MKRLVICCDGTWNLADERDGFTNVARLGWAVLPNDLRGPAPVPQICFYHTGVGTGDLVDRVAGGGAGLGLARNVRDCYSFIASNYCDGDEILLFGFSRGAYTARSVAGLIGWAGLLHKRDMDRFALLWESYKLRGRPDAIYVDERARIPDRHVDVPVRCVGVWDTVGALGIPGHIPTPLKKLYEFLDTSLGPHVQHAYHAMALDEHRSDFAPTLWTQPADQREGQTLEQVWFAGAHSNVGGGYSEHGLSDVALIWMAAKVEPLLAIDFDQIAAKRDTTADWGLGASVDSAHGLWRLLGTIDRRPLADDAGPTNEGVHASVRVRMDAPPAGYSCPSLGDAPGWRASVAPELGRETEFRWSSGSPERPSEPRHFAATL